MLNFSTARTACVCAALTFCGLTGEALAAGDLDFSIGDDTAKVQVSSQVPYNDLSWTAELLHYDEGDYSANLFGGGIFVAGRSNASTARQIAGIGGKFMFVDADLTEAGAAIAVGGFIRHTLSQANLISLRGEIFVAPGIVSFQGVQDYFEFSGRVEYQLLDQANIYLGYRSIEADMELETGGEAEIEFEDGLIAGVTLRF